MGLESFLPYHIYMLYMLLLLLLLSLLPWSGRANENGGFGEKCNMCWGLQSRYLDGVEREAAICMYVHV